MCLPRRQGRRRGNAAALLACLALCALLSGAAAEVFECGHTEPPAAVKERVQQKVETHMATSRMAFSNVVVPVNFHVISQVCCSRC